MGYRPSQPPFHPGARQRAVEGPRGLESLGGCQEDTGTVCRGAKRCHPGSKRLDEIGLHESFVMSLVCFSHLMSLICFNQFVYSMSHVLQVVQKPWPWGTWVATHPAIKLNVCSWRWQFRPGAASTATGIFPGREVGPRALPLFLRLGRWSLAFFTGR